MTDAVTLRCAEVADDAALRRLARLDSAAPLRGPVLVADLDGALRAAIALDSGRVIADPFQPTAALVELLRARERQLGAPAPARRRRGWARRRVPATG